MNTLKSVILWIIFLVIVVGIAIFAFPRYFALSKNLNYSQAQNIASNLTATSATNYTQRKANPASGIAIANCVDIISLHGNQLPTGYTIGNKSIPSDEVVICILNGPGIHPIEFKVIGIS